MILLPPTDHFLPGPASLSKTTVCVPSPECLPCDVVCCVTPCSSSLGTGMHLWQPSNRKRDMHNAFMKHKTRWASRRSHTGSPQPIHCCLHVHHTGKLDFNLEWLSFGGGVLNSEMFTGLARHRTKHSVDGWAPVPIKYEQMLCSVSAPPKLATTSRLLRDLDGVTVQSWPRRSTASSGCAGRPTKNKSSELWLKRNIPAAVYAHKFHVTAMHFQAIYSR